MPFNLEGRRIFLASPGDVSPEREIIRQTIANFNDQQAPSRLIAFLTRGLEQAKRGIGRPQALINEELDECDYMIVVLGHRWGSSSGSETYTSGTEEEFFQAVERRSSETAQLRDIHVFFKSVDRDLLLDPGPQLRKVLDFRQALETTKTIYFETFDSDESLRRGIQQSLDQWAADKSERVPVTIEFSPTDITTSEREPVRSTVAELLLVAKAKWDEGFTLQAETLFADAAKDNDPDALDQFAKFKRRTGELDYAKRLNQTVLTAELLLASDRDSISRVVRAQSNIGVILRKQGQVEESIRVFQEAIQQARSGSGSAPEELAYALDNYGHTLNLLLKRREAATQFADAAAIRRASGDMDGSAQSLVIAGHVLSQDGNHDGALGNFEAALRTMSESASLGLRANALAGKGKSLLKLARYADAAAQFQLALDTNRLIRNSDGISIALCGLAESNLATGGTDEARAFADAALRESLQSNNATGISTSNWLLYRISLVNGGSRDEQNLLSSKALDFAQIANNPGLLAAIKRTIVS